MKQFLKLLFFILFLGFNGITVKAQNVTISGANTGNGSYINLKAAFTAINGGSQTGSNILISIENNTTETSSAVLNAGTWTTITITPNGARTITGNLGAPLIDLNGADNVTIDGLNSGGNSLTISNTLTTSASGSSTVRFISDATNNKITNCNLLGSSANSLTTNGGIIFFSTAASGGSGNDNNTISYCNLGPAGSTMPQKCIYGNGSQTSLNIANSGNIVDNNNIYDFFSDLNSVSGIYINQGNDNWTISNNRIYQTAPRTFSTTALRYAGITIAAGGSFPGSFTITSNIIGFGSSNGTGITTITGSTNTFRGIDIPSVSTSIATSIQGNLISGINQTTASIGTTTSTGFVAMMLGTTAGLFNVGNITGNTIGSLDGSSNIVINSTAGSGTINGIYDFSVSNNNISNNVIGNITIQGTGTSNGFRGILVNTGTANTCIISNNTITNITDTQTGSYAIYGIQTSLPSITATGNTIFNFTGSSTGSGTIVNCGIISSGSSGVNTISQNVIHSLTNNSGSASNSIYGMSLSLPTTANIVEKNNIHSLSITGTNTGCQLWGISGGSSGTAQYRNNMIRLGLKPDGSSITNGFSVIGIFSTSTGTNNFYNNSVYIGGSGVISASNSVCLYNLVTSTRSVQNNIFWNARSNASGTIGNFALYLGTSVSGLTCNYNLLYTNGNSGAIGVFNSSVYNAITDWRTATGQDAKSINGDPGFLNATGNSNSVNLHIDPSIIFTKGRGTYNATITDDFDGDSRPISQSSSVSPVDIGADQFTPANYTGNVLSINGSAAYDGNLKAIEVTAGGFTTAGLRQFTGVRPPNSSMLKNRVNHINKDQKIHIFPGREIIEDHIVKAEINLTIETLPVIESYGPDKKAGSKNRIKSQNNAELIPEEKTNEKGGPGGSSGSSAILTPWIYWEIDNLAPTTEPIILRFYYNDEQLALINESDLKISYWNGTIWDDSFTQSVSPSNNYIEVTLPTGQGWPTTSVFALEDQGSPLPVILSDFDIFSSIRDVSLNWKTEMEINNKGFAIERRLKLQNAQYSQWREIAFVNGSGNSGTPVSYSYADKKLNSGIYQYRLKQVDYNGNTEYFNPAVNTDIVIGKPGAFEISQNYPNPSNPVSRIDFQMPFDGKVSIKVYDILGKEIAVLVNEYKSADFYTVEFNGSNLSSGTYFYRIIAEGNGQKFTKTMKMILVK